MHRTAVFILLVTALGMAAPGNAEPSPADAAKYRQAIMKGLSGHNGALRLIVANKAGDPANLANHVDALVSLADEVAGVFPAGSDLEDDESLPAIWENPDAFADAVARFTAAADALKSAAGSDDATVIGAALRDVGDGCKGCHEDFRVDD